MSNSLAKARMENLGSPLFTFGTCGSSLCYNKNNISDTSTYMQKISLPDQPIYHDSVSDQIVILCIVQKVQLDHVPRQHLFPEG